MASNRGWRPDWQKSTYLFLYALAPRWTSAVISLIATRPGALTTAGADFPPFLGVSRSQIDFKHRALSHPLLICFNSLELTDGTSAVISQIVPRPGALATAGADFPPYECYGRVAGGIKCQ